jgi:hypothetical protein
MSKASQCIAFATVTIFWFISNIAFSANGTTFNANVSFGDVMLGLLILVLAVGAAGGLARSRKD